MKLSRRHFLTLTGGTLASLGFSRWSLAQVPERRVLVLLELQGGQDGLNTFIPDDPEYERLRPRLAIPRGQRLPISPHLGLHPALEPLLPAWHAGEMALVQGLGYPRPNRSHFRGIEIWDTGASGGEYLDSGWLARGLPASFRGGYLTDGIVLGHNPGPLSGAGCEPLVMQRLDTFLRRAQRFRELTARSRNPALAHLLAVESGLARARGDLARALAGVDLQEDAFPNSRIGRAMADAARLILAGNTAPVIKLSHGSFDTHSNQLGRHERLLRQLAQALAAFRRVLQAQGAWDRVLLMTYSEFGRRVAENGSAGTDHGQAATHFLLGGRVKGGLHGEHPSLRHLADGDLAYTTDFRRLYDSVLVGWFGVGGLYPRRQQPLLSVLST